MKTDQHKGYLYWAVLFVFLFGCEKAEQQSYNNSTSKSTKDTQKVAQAQKYYTCPMHPTVKQENPGKCPICNMNLIEIEQEENIESHVHETLKTHTPSKAQVGDVVGRVKLKKVSTISF